MKTNKPRAMSEKPQPCRHKRPFCLECHGGEFQGSVSVKRTAIEYLKRNHPSACERAGLCETIGGRQYTVTLSCHSYVLASDYEALQAECERWKNAAHGAHRQLTANRLETEKLAVDWSKAMAECEELRGLLAEIGSGCDRRDMPSEQTIASWAEAIECAIQRQSNIKQIEEQNP